MVGNKNHNEVDSKGCRSTHLHRYGADTLQIHLLRVSVDGLPLDRASHFEREDRSGQIGDQCTVLSTRHGPLALVIFLDLTS